MKKEQRTGAVSSLSIPVFNPVEPFDRGSRRLILVCAVAFLAVVAQVAAEVIR